jgi:hypothetical protein
MQILLTSLTPFCIEEVGSFFSTCKVILSSPTGAGDVAMPKNVLGASAFDFSHIVKKIEEVYL